MSANPVTFDCDAGPCLGWFHRAQGRARGVGVLMCRPLGYEALCSYSAYTQLAHELAGAGFDVLRFDYHGTGDSAGGDADPGRVAAWLQSVEAAGSLLKALGGAQTLALFGMRLGATLAVQAALNGTDAASLMLWAPCPSGRAFVREMRAANAGRVVGTGAAAEGALEALGSLFTADTLEAMKELDCELVTRPPARRILVVGRDDIPAEGALPDAYRALGADVTFTVWPGYAGMMAEPHDARLEPGTIASFVQWLGDAHPLPATAPPEVERLQPTAPGFATQGAFETPVSFGANGCLFGVLAEPAGPASLQLKGESAVLLLNVGGNYRVGPNRIYVKAARELAAAGYRVLRFDVSGIGDSGVVAGSSSENMYRHRSVDEVAAAIDMLASRGCKRFWLLGICSGSYLAFETALRDSRVTGQMLLNSRLLEWDADKNGPWQSSMQQYYKSTRYYRQALLRGDVYARLLRGQVDVRGIARRLWTLARARFVRRVERVVGQQPPQEGVLAKMRHLCARGIDTFVMMSEEDDGLDYVEFHLGHRGARLRGQRDFRMALIEDADHTFSTVSSQRVVIEMLRAHLDARHKQAASSTTVPTRVVTI